MSSFSITIPRSERRFYYKINEEKIENSIIRYFKTNAAFLGKQLSSCFNIKDKTNFPHKNDLVYHVKCADESCNDDYVGETAKRISKRVTVEEMKILIF